MIRARLVPVLMLGLLTSTASASMVTMSKDSMTVHRGSVDVTTTVATTTRLDVIAACAVAGSTGADCKAAVLAYVAYLKSTGVSTTTLNTALKDLVVALGTEASKLDPTVFTEVKLVIGAAAATAASNIVGDKTLAVSLKEIGLTFADAGAPSDLGKLGDIGEDPASPS